MVKISKIKMVALILTLVFALTTFFACNENANQEPQKSGAKVITTALLNDFSDEKDLYQVLLLNGYGKMSLNKDKKYYSTGSGSAKLWLANNNDAAMILKQRLKSEVQNTDHTNFKEVKAVKTDIYNDSQEEVEIVFALEFSDGAKSPIKKYTLQSGWNYLNYAVDREMLSMQFDIEKTMYLSYTFSNNETPYTVYVDNISLNVTNSEIKEVVQVIDENEICSFDKNYQMSVFSLYVYSTVRIGYFSDFGLTANPDRVKSGKAFYVTTKAGMEDKGNYYWIKLNQKYGELIKWKSLTTEDSISFWIYCEGPTTGMSLSISNTKGRDLMDSGKDLQGNSRNSVTSFKAKANEWTEVKISVADIKMLADEKGYLEENEKIGDIITGINVGWAPFDDVAQKTLFFDEFKIIKGETN